MMLCQCRNQLTFEGPPNPISRRQTRETHAACSEVELIVDPASGGASGFTSPRGRSVGITTK